MRAYTHRFITFAIQSTMIILLAFGLSISAGHSLAQDVATDTPAPSDTATVVPTDAPTELPTIIPTDLPTEIPTDVPTAAPTEQATVEVTEAVTEQPSAAPTDAATAAPTDSATPPPATQASPDVFTEDFQNGAAAGWLLTPGWTVTDEAGNKILASSTTNDVATLTGIMWPYFTLSFRVRGNLQLNVASGGSSYQVKLSADGAAALYKDSVLVGQSAGSPVTDATVEPSTNWHTVNLLAPGNILAVKVDDFTPVSISDPSLLGMGPIIFSTSAQNTTSAAIDDLHIQRLDAPPPLPTVEPTTAVAPTPTAEITAEPTVDLTAEVTTEPTQEATTEATVEATLEATAEATLEVTQEATSEATAEATTEATAEATLEATAEATVEPVTLSDAARQKLPPELIDMLDKFQSGDVDGANAAAADSFITIDDQQRINVNVWTTDDQAAAKIVGDITATNGVITDALNIRLQALVTLETLTALANAPEVTLIEIPARAVSTSNISITQPEHARAATSMSVTRDAGGSGTTISEAVDTTGAAAWQKAGVKGAGVGIAVMDTGFGTSAVSNGSTTEYACLGSTSLLSTAQRVSGDTDHGLYMVQVLCDMAPAAKVYMYKATDASSLAAEILSAKNNANIKVIVIAMDLGVYAGPGDGTGGGANFSNPLYTNIAAARNAGKVVIASAGNNGCLSGISTLCHYVTLNYNAGTVSIPANIYSGDIINVSWNDWAGTLHGSTPEDFTSKIDSTTIYTGTRSSVSLAPRFQHLITPTECANTVDGCPVTLTLTRKTGDAGTIVVQVQITGPGNSTLDPTAITGGASVATGTGTIARPADSQDVIAVGAVCPDGPPINVNLDGLSSTGPIFAAGGDVPSVSAPFTQNQVKPDLASMTHVSVSLALAQNQGSCDITTGFNGTSAAAANVAGMAALLISNTNSTMSAFDGTTSAAVDALQNYLQTHTMDNTTTPGFAVGYDMSYGAGLTILGSPTYDLSQVVTPTSDPNQIPLSCTNGSVYVGSANPASAQSGTRTAPYISLNEAISKATAGQCVIVLPGEYVAQLYTDLTTATTMIMSYDAATSTIAAPSILWSVNSAPIFIQTNNLVIDGFTVKSAFTITYTKDDDTTTSLTPPAIRSRSASGEILQNNTFSDFRAPGILRGPNIQVLNNTFSNFIIPLGPTLNITQPASDTAVLKFENASDFVFSYNTLQNNYIPGTTAPTDSIYLPSILGLKNSTGDVFGNRFIDNKINANNPVADKTSWVSAIMGVNEWTVGPGQGRGSTKNTDEVRIFSNVFSGNSNHGPIVHFFQAPNMRFINNTVVKNTTDPANSAYDGYLVYGTTDMTDGAEIGNRRLEIHNNLFYNNDTKGNYLVHNAGIGTGCESISGGTPVRNNWFSRPMLAIVNPANDNAGECVDLLIPPTTKSTGTINESILDTDASPIIFFGTAADPVDPYRLRPNNTNTLTGGINTGDMSALTDMFGVDLSAVRDVLQGQRVLIGQNTNPAYFNKPYVDIGAYELTVPTPPVANPISQQIDEDSTTSVVFKLTATGGYSRLFRITDPPTNYDTNPTNACGGQPVVFTSPNIVTYCPPANFHTFYGSGGTDVPVTIGFSVVDNVGNPGVVSNSTISLTINPVNDGDPNQASPDLDFNLISDYVTPISQQLVPSYQINNFALSATGTDVDFPYAYTFDAAGSNNNPNLLGPSTVSVLQAAFTAANSNGGRLIINPVAGQKGFYSFTYKIADRDGAFVIGHITLVILPTLAKEGVYDDASFNFSYTGLGWTSSFVTGAYNNTLHATTASGDSVEIPFAGSSVRFNLRGSSAGTATSNTLNMAFKLNLATGSPTFQDYNTTKTTLGSGFSCINSLTAAAPDSSSNTKKYSTTSSAFTIFCSGFPVGQVHSIQLTNNLTNAAMTLDSAEVSAGVLTGGKSYPETSANFTYSGVWTPTNNLSALGGTYRATKDPNGKVSFNVDSSVGRLVIYRTTGPTTTYGSTEVYVGGVLAATISNVSTSALYAQPYLLTLTPGNQTVELRNVGSKTSSIDQIDALPIVQSLSAGTYQENYTDLTYLGVWTSLVSAAPLGGSVRYTKIANASMKFKVDATVGRITIYRTTASTYGSTQIFIDGAATPVATIVNKSTTTLYGQPYTFTVTPANHTIELRNVGTTYSSIDQILLQGPAQALTTAPGIYEENESNFTFSGNWSAPTANGAAFGGAWRYTTEAGASLTFSIDSSVTRIFIYRTTGAGYGSMQVFLDGSTTPVATINNIGTGMVFQQPVSVNIVSPASHTVTIKNVAATNSNIDRILLLGDPTPLSTSPGTYQEDSTNLNYSGTWVQATNALALGSPAKYRYTTTKDASVSFLIDNSIATRMVIYRTTGPGYGSMEVFINGASVATISNVSGNTLYGQPVVVDIPALAPGVYPVKINNKAATNSNIDQITMLGAPAALTTAPGTYQETNPNLTYTGSWIQSTNAAAFINGYRYTTALNASVKFAVDSSVKRMVIYRTIGSSASYGSMDVLLDANTTPHVTIPNTSSSTLYGQPFFVDIPSGTTLITIKNKVANKSSNIDQIVLLGDPVALTTTPGTYQESDPNLTYTPNWLLGSNPLALGNGKWRYTTVKDANVTFSINTATVTRMIIYRTTGAGYGSMDVSINNAFVANIPNVGTGVLYGQPFVVNIPSTLISSPGTYSVKINNKAGGNISIDQIDLLADPTPLDVGSYQENDPNFTYSNNWLVGTNTLALNGKWSYTITAGATMTFPVDTTNVSRMIIYRTIGSGYGSLDVLLDSNTTPHVTISNTNSTVLYGQPFSVDIPFGTTTITLKNKAKTNSSIDQIDLLSGTSPLTNTPGIYQENDPNITYTGTWLQGTSNLALAGGWRYTTAIDATVTLRAITPAVTRMVIYRTIGTGYGSLDLLVDNNATPVLNISNTNATVQYGQPFVIDISALGLSVGTHIFTFKNKTAKNSSIDQIVLLGSAQALSTTTGSSGVHQETEPNLLYSGLWTQTSNPSAIAGAWSYTNQAGANVAFTIDSSVSRVVLYRTTNKIGYGSLQVFLDGAVTPLTTISNVDSALLFGQPIVINIPTPGNHILILKNVGASNSNIDQITLLGPSTALAAPNTLQETDFNLTYTGVWTQSLTPTAFSGSRRYTKQKDATVSFSVDNTVSRIVIFRTTGPASTYGSLQVFDGNTLLATISNVGNTVMYGQPFFLDVTATGHTITLKNVAATQSDIDQIVLLGTAASTPLSTAQVYEETDPAFAYTGLWARATGTGPSGNAAYYTYTPGATVTFKFTGRAFSLYQMLASGGGTFTVKIDNGTAQSFSTKSAATLWQQTLDFGPLTNTLHTVVITNTSPAANFIYFDAIRIIDITVPLIAGEYQNTYPSLTYTGAWAVDTTAGQSLGAATFTTTPNDQMSFNFVGTGFGIMTDNLPTGTTSMDICYTGPSSDCKTYSTVANPKLQLNVGYSFYGLKQGSYTVTVKHTGTAGQGLYIDRIFVLDTPPTVLQPNINYENTAAGIVYSPSSLWTTMNSASHSGGNARGTLQKGAVMQVRFNGGTMFLYQAASTTAAKSINLCVLLTDASGNPTSLCTTFSQKSTTSKFIAPVAFYGFGSGNHEVIFENQIQASQFNVDKILVQ